VRDLPSRRADRRRDSAAPPQLQNPTGRTADQLVTLAGIGMLDRVPPHPATLLDPEGSGPLEGRARSYLHANCAFCHQPGGNGRSGTDLRFGTPLSRTRVCNAAPERGDLGVADARLLFPGDPARSVLSLRMHARDQNGMPPFASLTVDEQGTNVVDAFIRSVGGCQP
jgi:mono/diheme cytochrome c family protein